ncbi:uncharacterized protein B0T15DRAFT_524885 [Chaetomium strumarium]|uniref:Uncharacterized protein n=1 Tax=Chaetomium strumarium TaxID=1170767 RepID=A0AAJ0GYS4_9PEZI|nr:hypothetical protein B0T15DRAFT_524885 [Chaetomium strumarium]
MGGQSRQLESTASFLFEGPRERRIVRCVVCTMLLRSKSAVQLYLASSAPKGASSREERALRGRVSCCLSSSGSIVITVFLCPVEDLLEPSVSSSPYNWPCLLQCPTTYPEPHCRTEALGQELVDRFNVRSGAGHRVRICVWRRCCENQFGAA